MLFLFRVRTSSGRLAALSLQRGAAGNEEEYMPAQGSHCDDHVDPDAFDRDWQRLPKNHETATAHAELVLEDRMRLELELHYDEVFREEWGDRQEQNADKGAAPRRPGASRIQYRVMECLRHRRYETLGLPDELRRVLWHPRQEKSSTVVEEVADVLRMLCCKGRQIAVRHQHELEKIIADVKVSKERLLQQNHACVDGVLLRGSKLIAVHAVANDIAVPQKQSGDVLTALQHSKKHLPAYITVLEDPCGTDCVIPLSSFGKKLSVTTYRPCDLPSSIWKSRFHQRMC